MRKILQAESTLTDRYQTTIPESIRDSLHLNKRDKITYTIEEKSKIIVYTWVNDENTKRTYNNKSDAYHVFKKMLSLCRINSYKFKNQ